MLQIISPIQVLKKSRILGNCVLLRDSFCRKVTFMSCVYLLNKAIIIQIKMHKDLEIHVFSISADLDI